jgi:hypothetical protein
MPKNTKSSASSATRKRKAAKAAKKGGVEDEDNAKPSNGAPADKTLQRGQKKVKGKKKEPKKKVYIPPVKPKADIVDPLDSMGLASLLPADLVVLLRKAGKKDVTTRIRALEGILEWQQASKNANIPNDDADISSTMSQEERDAAFIVALPSWTHLFPRLVSSPNRRLRQLTVQATAFAMSREEIKADLIAQPMLMEQIVGPLLIVAHGPDRLISRMALTLFESTFAWGGEDRTDLHEYYPTLLDHVASLLFQEAGRGLHEGEAGNTKQANGASAAVTIARDAKNRDDAQVEEDAEGTDGRLVAGALGSLTWLINSQIPEEERDRILPMLSEPILWSALSMDAGSEDRSLGHLSPFVRISGWGLLRSLVASWPHAIETFAHIVAPTALFSAFQERDLLVSQSMREGLIRLLRLRPDLWILAADEDRNDEDDENEDSDDDSVSISSADDAGEVEKLTSHEEKSSAHTMTSIAMAAFMQYLRSAVCNIASSYSTVILLLATVPDEIMPPTSANALEVLRAIYAPVDERSIEGRDMQRALFSAFLECLVWLTGRVAARTSLEEALMVFSGIDMAWNDLFKVADPLRQDQRPLSVATIGEERLGKELASCLRKVGNIDVKLAQPMLELVRTAFDDYLASPGEMPIETITQILKYAIAPREDGTLLTIASKVQELVRDITFTTANIVASGEATAQGVTVLTLLLDHFDDIMTEESVGAIDLAQSCVLQGQQSDITSDQKAAFAITFLQLPALKQGRGMRWQSLLLATLLNDGQIDWSLLRSIQEQAIQKDLTGVQGASQALDSAVLQRYADNITVSSRLVARPEPILRNETAIAVIAAIAQSKAMAHLPIVEAWLKGNDSNVQMFTSSVKMRVIVPDIYRAAIFSADRHAALIWSMLSRQDEALTDARSVLQREIVSIHRPMGRIVAEIGRSRLGWQGVLPSTSEIHDLLMKAPKVHVSSRLAISDPLVLSNDEIFSEISYDEDGCSVVARVELGILAAVEQDRQMRHNAALLPYLVDFAIAAEDALLESTGGRSHFRKDTSPAFLAEQLERSVAVSTSLIAARSSSLDAKWFESLCKELQDYQGKEDTDELRCAFRSLWDLHGAHRPFARLLRGCLSFSGAGSEEAGILLRLAQVSQQSRPHYAYAIVTTTKTLCQDLPLYDRLRNQVAADLAGVKASEASRKGLDLLTYLVHLAPSTDSPLSLIPQQRAVFLLRTLQTWIASDEELSPSLMTGLAKICRHLLPIVQEMPGSHLDLIIDVVEMNMAEGSLRDDPSLVQTYHTLQLLDTLVTLADRSAALREVWKDRRSEIFSSLRKLIFRIAKEHDSSRSDGRVEVEEAAADVTHILPISMFKQDFDNLLQITQLHTTSTLPIFAYRILAQTIRETVQEQIIENAVGSKQVEVAIAHDVNEPEGEKDVAQQKDEFSKALQLRKEKQQLPQSLIEVLNDASITNLLAYLLAWLTAFEFFEENSLELRVAYTTQLQSHHLIDGKLMPLLMSFLNSTKEQNRFELDEIFLEHLDGTDVQCLEIFTVHIFYRALIHTPSLVCDAFFAIKDKQQSTLLKTLTMRYLTPLLSQREFGHLREPGILSRLQDENMQIKVLANISEVIATYTIDEYPLELAITMPNDYPLHPVEVRDLKKIGITEGTWRAWILGMRQLIAGRNGLIFDALLLFKRNVEAKFSGFDEDSTCSICYSIVSPTDHSLPTKPCKTCKKRFHASCLYKWVSTSGSSTCPLCRSIL